MSGLTIREALISCSPSLEIHRGAQSLIAELDAQIRELKVSLETRDRRIADLEALVSEREDQTQG